MGLAGWEASPIRQRGGVEAPGGVLEPEQRGMSAPGNGSRSLPGPGTKTIAEMVCDQQHLEGFAWMSGHEALKPPRKAA